MNKKSALVLMLLGGLAFNPLGYATDEITVAEEGASPDDIIMLPESASITARGVADDPATEEDESVEGAAQFGLDTANSARELGREFGENMASEARDNNARDSIRDEMTDEARRGGRPDDLPTGG